MHSHTHSYVSITFGDFRLTFTTMKSHPQPTLTLTSILKLTLNQIFILKINDLYLGTCILSP